MLDEYGEVDNPSLETFYELLEKAKTCFLDRILCVCRNENIPLVPLEDDRITLCNLTSFSFEASIPNPNYEKQLAEYNAWEKAEQQKRKEEIGVRAEIKKQSHEQRINNRIAFIVSSSEKSANEKLKEIEKLLGK